MLTIHNVSKSFGLQTVLNKISFTLKPRERVGLVGANGCGKTTLMRIIARLDPPDEGLIRFTPSRLRLGYLPQGIQFRDDETIHDFLFGVESELEHLAAALAASPQRSDLQTQYDLALAQLAAVNGSGEVLASLGLDGIPAENKVAALSGGQKTRLALARVLLSDPQLLLLDEPTNHLDLEMLNWLEEWLNQFHGAALIVSHDRAFLDNTVTRIVEIDEEHTAHEYAGDYSAYVQQKMAAYEKQYQEYRDQIVELEKLHNAARHLRRLTQFKVGGKSDTRDKFAKGFFGDRTTHTARRALRIEKRIEKTLEEDRKEKPKQSWEMKLEFKDAPASGNDVLTVREVSVGYDRPLLTNLNLYLKRGARAVLMGANGCGKTTLLRTIAGVVPPLRGELRLGANIRLGYMTQEQEGLDPDLNAMTIIRSLAPFSETEARAFLHFYLFSGDDVFTPVRLLSFGERSRLMLATFVARGCNFLLLDEPINHLDIPSRSRFEQALTNFDGTILAVVHDRYFVEAFATEVWEVREGLVETLR
jgi:ATP-binding cassette subfamily F protein 3